MLIDLDKVVTSLGEGDWPILTRIDQAENTIEITLDVPNDLGVFEGHFPEHAVLPGILQVHWAAELGRRLFAETGTDLGRTKFTSLRGIKFNSMVLPSSKLQLRISLNRSANNLKFEFSNTSAKFSSGIIQFSAEDTEVQQ